VNEIWAAIEPEVDAINAERRRRRLIPFFWLFGVLALSVSVGGYYLWASADTMSQSSELTRSTPQTITSANAQTNAPTNSTEAVSLAEATIQNSNKEANNKASGSATNASAVNTNEKSIINDNINNSDSPKFHFVKPTPKPTQQAQSDAIPTSGSAFDLPVEVNEKAARKPIAQDAINTSSSAIGLKATSDESVELRGLAGEWNRGSIALDLLDFEAEAMSKEVLDLWPYYDLPEVGEEAEVEKLGKNKPFQFSIESSAGLAFVRRNLTSTSSSPEGNAELIAFRNQNEKPLEAQNYGLYTKLKHTSGFTFATGLHRTIITELYEYNDTEISTQLTEGIATRVVQLNGDTLDFVGALDRITTTTYNQKIYNRYRFWEVPLLVGYEKTQGKWSYGVEAGVFVLFRINGDGQIRMPLEIAFESLNTSMQSTQVYQESPSISYRIGGRIERAFGEHLSVALSPYLRRYGTSVLLESNGVSQKYNIIGANLGVGWKF